MNFFCDKKLQKTSLKIDNKDKFLVGSADNLRSNWNSDFQENALKKYYKDGCGPWFDTFMEMTLYFLDHHLNEVIELAFFFYLFTGHIICIYLYKYLMTF